MIPFASHLGVGVLLPLADCTINRLERWAMVLVEAVICIDNYSPRGKAPTGWGWGRCNDNFSV